MKRKGLQTAFLKILRFASVAVIVMYGFTITTNAAPPPAKPVEVWKTGDDGLTNRLHAAISSALGSTTHFFISTDDKPGTLYIYIPRNVSWQKIGQRTKVTSSIEYRLKQFRSFPVFVESVYREGNRLTVAAPLRV